jgi:hypothetical protein
MPDRTRLLTALLAVVLVLQLWLLQRQSHLGEQLQQMVSRHNQLERLIQSEVHGLEGQLRTLADAQTWVDIQEEQVSPLPSCDGASVKLAWQLREWAEATTTRLLYRSRPDEPWQEAPVQALGGQSYTAAFTVPGKPQVEVDVVVEVLDRTRGGAGMASTSRKPDDRWDYQYALVAEGTGFHRSTGARSLPLGQWFRVGAKGVVRVRPDATYEIDLHTDPADLYPCVRIDSAEVRGYAGDRLVTTQAMAWQEDRFTLRLEQVPELTRLELVIRHGGEQSVVPVTLRP